MSIKVPTLSVESLCRTQGFPKVLFIDTGTRSAYRAWNSAGNGPKKKAGKIFKVTELNFSYVIALNGLAKIQNDCTLQIHHATFCIF